MADTLPRFSIDLFAGAGGLSEGLRQAGFKTLYANEVHPVYAEAFSVNHPEAWVQARDIRLVNPLDVRLRLGLQRGELDLVAGGPPCQGFSINAPIRRTDDERNHLFRDFLRFVEEFEPKAVLVENVPGLVSFNRGSTLGDILTSLELLGYKVDVRILYAPHFGIPQTRWRTFIIGLRADLPGDPQFPVATHWAPARVNFTSTFRGRQLVVLPPSRDLRPFTTVQQAIGDLPPLRSGETGPAVKQYPVEPMNDYQRRLRHGSPGVLNHEAAKLAPVNLARLAYIPPGGNWTDIPFDLLPAGMKKARPTDHTKRYGRADPNGLSSTILTKCDPHWGAYFHYSQDRSFTVREAARLQSFPDRYRFVGSRVAQYEQVGNAVPPLLAAALGKAIRQSLGEAQEESSPSVAAG